MPRSEKIEVLEHLYAELLNEGKNRTVVYKSDVVAAIAAMNEKYGRKMSTGNPANFMKDIVRKDNASANWPDSLKRARIGGRQRVGQERILEFVPYKEGQTEPFTNPYMPSPEMEPIPVQSLSLPLASKVLGRKDESWLVQASVDLHVLEAHFAQDSSTRVRELVHLQTGVKLNGSEIDCLYRAVIEKDDNSLCHALVSCEAKQEGERIVDHQIIGQVVASYRSTKAIEGFDVDCIIPVAVKAIGPNGDIYVIEFESWSPSEAEEPEATRKETLIKKSDGLYRLIPPVPGIGFRPKKVRKSKGK